MAERAQRNAPLKRLAHLPLETNADIVDPQAL